MNAEWHRQHRMPARATIDQRMAWHREHARHCACRPIPPKLLEQMGTRTRPRKTASSRKRTLL
jgi:hypothetical protein